MIIIEISKLPLLSVNVSVCSSATLMLTISKTKRFRGLCAIGSLKESAYGASIGDVIVVMTSRDYGVTIFILVTFGN